VQVGKENDPAADLPGQTSIDLYRHYARFQPNFGHGARSAHLFFPRGSNCFAGLLLQAQLKYSVTPSEISALWERLEARVDARVQEIAADPDGCIPEVDIDDILSDKVDAETIARLRVSGVIKIRRTVEREVAERLNRDIMADLVAYFGVDPERPETYTAIYNDTDPKTFTFGGALHLAECAD